MGWFWADRTVAPSAPAPHPMPHDSKVAPPPGCPMHKSSGSASAFSATPVSALSSSSSPNSGGCPVKHASPLIPSSTSVSSTSKPLSSSPDTPRPGLLGKLNPLNYMPALSQSAGPNQAFALPTSREPSSIPRGDANTNWEYPSPQQMYNAMLRKGYDDTPAEHVASMVAVHNFLNEGAWEEIESWEARFSRGLGFGWRTCRSGEEGFVKEYLKAKAEDGWKDTPEPRLMRFMGRPQDMTPKARAVQMLGGVMPRFRSERPFDRHDWTVQRQLPDGSTKEVRYVIDYYSAPPEPTGEPVFYLDVRPAIDTPTAAVERMMRWGGDVWYRASGAAARE